MGKKSDASYAREFWRRSHKVDETLTPLTNYFIRKMEKDGGGDPEVSADAESLILAFLEGKTSVEIAEENASSEERVVDLLSRAVKRIVNVVMDADVGEIGTALGWIASEQDNSVEIDGKETLKKIVRLLNEMQYSERIEEDGKKLLGESTLAYAGYYLSEGREDATRFRTPALRRSVCSLKDARETANTIALDTTPTSPTMW